MRLLPHLIAITFGLFFILNADESKSVPLVTPFPKENPGAIYPELKIYDAQANRTLILDGNRLKDLVHIATTDGKPHALGFLLHLMGKAENLPSSFIPDPNPAQIEPVPGFNYWQDASRAIFRDRAGFEVKFGDVTLHVDFALLGEFTIWHASAPDLLPRRRDVFYIETHGQEATLQTTLQSESGTGAAAR